MVFMLIVTITSLVQTLIANFKGLGAGVGIGWCVARIVLAGLLVILARSWLSMDSRLWQIRKKQNNV